MSGNGLPVTQPFPWKIVNESFTFNESSQALICLTWDPRTPPSVNNPQIRIQSPMDSWKLSAKLWCQSVSWLSAHPEVTVFRGLEFLRKSTSPIIFQKRALSIEERLHTYLTTASQGHLWCRMTEFGLWSQPNSGSTLTLSFASCINLDKCPNFPEPPFSHL